MNVGETILAPVNGGQWEEAQIIEIHGDIVRVAGAGEMSIVQRLGRTLLGVGFPIRSIKEKEKANNV